MSSTPRSGAQILVDQLPSTASIRSSACRAKAISRVLDALYDQQERIRLISAGRRAARRSWPRPTAS